MAVQYGDNRKVRPGNAPGNSARVRNTDPGRVDLSSADIRDRLATRSHMPAQRRSLLEAALQMRGGGGARPGPGPRDIMRPNTGPSIGIGDFERNQINRVPPPMARPLAGGIQSVGAGMMGGLLGGARPGPGPSPIMRGAMGGAPIGGLLGGAPPPRPMMDPGMVGARSIAPGGGAFGGIAGLIPGYNPSRPIPQAPAMVGIAPAARFGGLVNPMAKFANRGSY